MAYFKALCYVGHFVKHKPHISEECKQYLGRYLLKICFSFAVPSSSTNGVDQKTSYDKTKVEIIKPIEEVDNNNNEETMLVRLVITIEIFYLI